MPKTCVTINSQSVNVAVNSEPTINVSVSLAGVQGPKGSPGNYLSSSVLNYASSGSYFFAQPNATLVCSDPASSVIFPSAIGRDGEMFTVKNVGSSEVTLTIADSGIFDGVKDNVILQASTCLTVQAAGGGFGNQYFVIGSPYTV